MKFQLYRGINGNTVLRVHPDCGRAFSIQTSGNLPKTDAEGVGSHTHLEVWTHVLRHGTDRQFEAIGGKGDK